jgi:glucose-6-phosphate isomerase
MGVYYHKGHGCRTGSFSPFCRGVPEKLFYDRISATLKNRHSDYRTGEFMNNKALWERYQRYLCVCPSIGMQLDISRMGFPDDYLPRMEPAMQKAFHSMALLEAGAVANPDENRMVGHYWLRNPELSPSPEIRREIEQTVKAILKFVHAIHAGSIKPEKRARFTRMLCIGIGGSALGPQFVSDALGTSHDRLKPFFIDNTDPDGIDRVLSEIGNDLAESLTIVISKSGGTIETRNGMVETAEAYRKKKLKFEKHAVAITGVGSKLDIQAINEKWITRFPMWEWVGGRTSITSAVGLLPMALQGIDIIDFISGSSICDSFTKNKFTSNNPAALLALMWHYATDGHGSRDMVILPYKDRLHLFAKYLQQLIMESIGKEKDLLGKTVNQGITVFGNKGATDQHAYVQQLREGLNNFFATFIEVLEDRAGYSIEVEPGVTSGDYLNSYLQGTRNALYEKGRHSLTITIDRLDARSIGALIALYERAVGLYSSLVNINAYHQPGVEAGKKMAGAIIAIQNQVLAYLHKNPGQAFTAEEIARSISVEDSVEIIFKVLLHASANKDHKITKTAGKDLFSSKYESSR